MEKILDKIKKCLALSQSSEPHEAAAALRQAQKLMQLHNVDMTTVERSEVGQEDVKSKFSVSVPKSYEVNLVQKICRSFGCEVLWAKSHSRKRGDDRYASFKIIGLKHQVKIAAYTCDVMQRKMHKARHDFIKTHVFYDRVHTTREANGFCMGWAEAVTEVITKFAGTDIPQIVKDEHFRLSRSATRARATLGTQAGFDAGKVAGSSESIQRPMGSNPTSFLTK